MRTWLVWCALLVACACDVGGTQQPQAGGPDAGATPAANALGQPCATAADCESTAAHECVIVQGLGSQSMGYCSPACATATDCTEGYGGPGEPVCMTDRTPPTCMIKCVSNADCPTGLDCIVTGGPVNVCLVP